jgi:hypothetical protein
LVIAASDPVLESQLACSIKLGGIHSGKLMLKLIATWIAMGFRKPEITLGKTVHRAQ